MSEPNTTRVKRASCEIHQQGPIVTGSLDSVEPAGATIAQVDNAQVDNRDERCLRRIMAGMARNG